ncbi:cytochrome P450 [Mycobacterium seoulense]|uniref:cytochrome P450 n=1 Tax=Mycobacterium seoulense TaxID=386911 RepID=UPI003CEC9A9A
MANPSVPKFDIEGLPVADARDEAWQTLGKCPIVEVEGGYAVTEHGLVQDVLKTPSVFSSEKAFDVLGSPVPMVPIAFDPPEQTRYRQILTPFFGPAAIRPLEPSLRNQIVDLVEPIAERGHCEFIAEIARTFPVQVFLSLFGLPLDMRDQLIEWKEAMLGLTTVSGGGIEDQALGEEYMRKAFELFTYLSELVKERRGKSGDDVLTQIANVEDGLKDEELVGLSILLVLAGLDTVTDALGMGMQRLAENPDKRQEIVDDPSLIPEAVEELLRLDPPAPLLPRVTSGPVCLGGTEFPADTRIAGYISTANRDEENFARPNEIDFHRKSNRRHMSFGLGAHRCLGSHLARLELAIVYEEWHKRIPHYHVTPGTTPRIHWPSSLVSLESLHLTVGHC